MSSVLGIVGSPRRNGNTHHLVSKILDGARQQGATVKTVFLGDQSIRECDGCHACWHGNACSKQDDMNKIYQQINQTDILVLGTPVYWYGPTALMKGFMDRFVYYNCEQNRVHVKGKSVVLAIPFEDESVETVMPVLQFFERSLSYLGMNLAGKVIAQGISKKGEIVSRTDLLESAFLLGKKVAQKQ